MKRIAYLLHQFPRATDTFIKREIRSLQSFGTSILVISVWRPHESDTTPDSIAEWEKDTVFVLPKSILALLFSVCRSAITSPMRFWAAFHLALCTAKPGIRGLVYQFFYFVEAILVADVLVQHSIDHVHNHLGDQSGTVTMLAARRADIGYSISFHGPHIFWEGKYAAIKEKMGAAQFVRAISYFCRSQLMLFAGSDDADRIKIIHCGLNIDRYAFRSPRKEVKRLFCASRLAPEKGLKILVGALKILRDQGHDLELRLAGDGPSRSDLAAFAAHLGLSDKVRFLGYLPEAGVISELQAADLFVLSSFAEGLPVSAMEAMAVGVPVVATNIAGMSELIADGKSGLLVRPSDAKAMAEAITTMIGDHEFRRRAAELGRRKIVEEFDVDRESARLNDYLLQSCR